MRMPASLPTSASFGPPVSTTCPAAIGPALVSTPVTRLAPRDRPRKATCSRTSHRHAQPGLHGHPRAGGSDLGFGEARQQISLGDEARVDADLVVLAQVEIAGPLAETHCLGGAALGAYHSRSPAARALAEDAPFQHDDPTAGPAQEIGTPGTHGPTAHDHGVGGVRVASGGHWHEPDAGID
jgi:hypothetical protein